MPMTNDVGDKNVNSVTKDTNRRQHKIKRFQPLLINPGKLIQYFSEILVFRGVT